jgi:two-component system cell cycle sensor histidine kinase/response regulator CckA
LQGQLRQAQKMEAFGQLAGGVAHDFNNILTVILGNASILQLTDLDEETKTSAIAEIIKSAERAANLTRQLLTFSHRQPIQASNMDLNEVVKNITTMLQRLIGEHISLVTLYAPGGALIHADRSMMDQVLVNLAVNSRDAMPKGGRLTVQTAVATIDERMTHTKPGTRPGEFIRLSVTDSGQGIEPEHLAHIFEPFFTTKEVGKGTGLGLATVFGIVEQHHGWIDVESKLNSGTSFDIYLPRLAKNNVLPAEHKAKSALPHGTETILLAEDDDSVREFVQTTLVLHGYQVHATASGASALRIWETYKDSIDLLVTDMVMPGGVSGRELADRIKTQKPEIKVIYCSGYTDDMLGESSLLRNNINFLEKPFSQSALLQRVRDCLDEA